ncbi:hypothetical protein ACFPYI_19165 [Halomarina salina]|uniref:Uncharacterized protein n=1 Tax=Halomarina salina TaxID=1872699 RepID=A0ABD5RT16_9EURY|nr:hypothetical protein [Halomarina salina]
MDVPMAGTQVFFDGLTDIHIDTIAADRIVRTPDNVLGVPEP